MKSFSVSPFFKEKKKNVRNARKRYFPVTFPRRKTSAANEHLALFRESRGKRLIRGSSQNCPNRAIYLFETVAPRSRHRSAIEGNDDAATMQSASVYFIPLSIFREYPARKDETSFRSGFSGCRLFDGTSASGSTRAETRDNVKIILIGAAKTRGERE